ncbi:MAG: TolC family protein [Candidatus Omnitrophica bacterium]|nr:TolC family protein [Candidatus Omnitrophota bacterium]
MRLTRAFLILFLILLQVSNSYASSEISQRNQQLKSAEQMMRNNQNQFESEAGLKDYIRTGLENNPGLKEKFYNWQAAFTNISQAFSLPDPQFTFTEYIDSVETRVGPQQRAFSLTQKIPLSDKLWIKKSKAFNASEEAYYQFETMRSAMIYQITDAYYEYAYLNKAILLTQENIELLTNFESVAEAKYKSGLAKNQDLLKIQVELGKLENDLLSQQDMREPLAARLRMLLNLPNNIALPWPDESLEDAVMEENYNNIETLYPTLKSKNPEILALSEKIEKNKDAVKLSKRDYIPDLTLGITQIVTGDALNPNTVDSGKDALMVMLSVNVPIWNNRLGAQVQESRASLKAAENLLQSKENELFSKLALVHYKLRDSLRQSQLYKDGLLPKAAQALNSVQSSYESGGVDFLSLIDAQRMLLNFQLAYYRQNANFYQRLAELQNILGEVEKYQELK